jgi:Zn-dependent metalloprotease
MRRITHSHLFATLALGAITCFATTILQAQNRLALPAGVNAIQENKFSHLPSLLELSPGKEVNQEAFPAWALSALKLPETASFKPYSTETDALGFTHVRYKQFIQGIPVENTMVITHAVAGKVQSFNGDYCQAFGTNYSAGLTEKAALQHALAKVAARKYKWENKTEEAAMRLALNNPSFTYAPQGELVVVHTPKADYSATSMRLAYKFNIYAEEPLYRANVYVDAQTGKIVDEQSLIETTDVVGTAVTRYSGTVAMTSDNYGAGQYRLRETGRGTGIETYNLNTDFTNGSATWNVSGTDQAAADAHWGAEKTYDFYFQNFNRNSIDNAGFKLISYVHYSTNFVNAYWDGQRMTYGDGNPSQGYNIMTALDVCGHEITHGLTANTARLGGTGSGEPGALNEGFSDIFGTSIEHFARPTQNDWLMGADLTTNGQGLRNMANPKQINQPDTYMGTNWDPNGEVHNNDGPCIFWYYLMCQGKSGTNDIGSAYNVTAIGISDAAKIAFRALTVYFTPTTSYADARTYTIKASTDLFGSCSPQTITCTNAWYAVGVGAQYVAAPVAASFTASQQSLCTLPANVQFNNATTNGLSYTWTFGDGGTSTSQNPIHTYTTAGSYTVKLVANGCSGNAKDSVVKSNYIVINPPASPAGTGAAVCGSGSLNLTASAGGTLTWYNSGGTKVGTGSPFTTPVLSSTTTFYVTNTVQPAAVTGAPATNATLGTGGYLNASHYLIFDALSAFTLQTVDVYAQGATGSAPTIALQDSAGAVLFSTNPSLPVLGKNTVSLNFHINAGKKYRLVASGANINLYRNNAGASYPIAVGSLASITGTDVSASNPAYYYFFYNWVIQADGCESGSTAVVATVNTKPVVTFNYAGPKLCTNGVPITLSANPAGGVFSGTGVSGNKFSPNGLTPGSYVLSYTYTGAGGCQGVDTATIAVQICSGIASYTLPTNVTMFPNPAQDMVTLQSDLFMSRVTLLDVTGRLVSDELINHQNVLKLDLASLPAGVYFVKVVVNEENKIFKLVKK